MQRDRGTRSEAGAEQAGAEQAGTALRSGMMPGREVLAHRGLVGLDLGVERGIDGLERRLVVLEVGGDLGDLVGRDVRGLEPAR